RAQSRPGWKFVTWTGQVLPAFLPLTHALVQGPLSLTVQFAPLPTTLNSILNTKTGPANARVWGIQVNNTGLGAASALMLTQMQLTQAGGGPCTPRVKTPLPVQAATIPPLESGSIPVTIDFTGCDATARFTLSYTVNANSGGAISSRTLYNQFR